MLFPDIESYTLASPSFVSSDSGIGSLASQGQARHQKRKRREEMHGSYILSIGNGHSQTGRRNGESRRRTDPFGQIGSGDLTRRALHQTDAHCHDSCPLLLGPSNWPYSVYFYYVSLILFFSGAESQSVKLPSFGHGVWLATAWPQVDQCR
ncbi:hypothetical protein LZ30DRAFT_730351 [Colletotrichum cereale]|nr:hypothetical protein LZ30DRAFT_730351 [Colletotrichum cereale]